MTPSEIITSISLLVASLAALIKAVTGLIKEMRRKPKRKKRERVPARPGGRNPTSPIMPWNIMRTESIVSAVFALGTAASAWFGWPFALTAGCAIVSAVFALIAGRKD